MAPSGTDIEPSEPVSAIPVAENLSVPHHPLSESLSGDLPMTDDGGSSELTVSDFSVEPVQLRRSERIRKPVDRLDV